MSDKRGGKGGRATFRGSFAQKLPRKKFHQGKLSGKVSSKAQAAMEYLMTYGWAIIIIAVVLITFFQLGVFSSANLVPRAQPGNCRVARLAGMANLEGVCQGELPEFVGQFNGQPTTFIKTQTLPAYTQLTITGWVKVSSTGTANYGGLASPFECGPIWATPNGLTFSPEWDACECVGIGACYTYASLTLPTNQWLMIAYASDGNGNVMGYGFTPSRTYSAIHSGSAFTIPSAYWLIGAYDNFDGSINGSVADVQAYNTTLDANQLQALYLKGIGGAPVDPYHLIGWWPLNGNGNDYSGNNNNGAATNVVYSSQWMSGYTQP